jgi:hypothetical protein
MSAIDEYRSFQGTAGFVLFSGIAGLNGIEAKEVFFAVRDEVIDGIGDLTPGARYRSKHLCGDVLWSILGTRGLHSAIGICVSFLVKHDVVPLVCVTSASFSNKWYSLKSSMH